MTWPSGTTPAPTGRASGACSRIASSKEQRAGRDGPRIVYRVRPDIAAQLARECVYVEQGKSGRAGAKRRPLFEQMKRDGAARKFGGATCARSLPPCTSWPTGGDRRAYQIADRADHLHPGKVALGNPSLVRRDGERRMDRGGTGRPSASPRHREACRTAQGGIPPRRGSALRAEGLWRRQVADQLGAGVGPSGALMRRWPTQTPRKPTRSRRTSQRRAKIVQRDW